MSRAGMMILFRAQIEAVEAEIRAKQAQIASLRAAQEDTEMQLKALERRKDELQKGHAEIESDNG